MAAPLVHVHLDAASSAAAGQLCGEHTNAGSGVPDAGPCPICLATSHGHAVLAREFANLRLPALPGRTAAPPAPTLRAAPERCASAPRAPPALV